jgi:arylformamidase
MSERITFTLEEQPSMGIQAAVDYARTILDWSSYHWPGVVEHRDLAYGPDPRQRLDLFVPEGAKNAPVMIFFHGGGWCTGHKEWAGFMVPALARLGVILVAPNYRLAPGHKMPAAFDDGIAVLKKVTEMLPAMGGDPGRMFLSGHSAGGHLAALIALRRADRERAGLSPDAIRGGLPVSGIFDLHHPSPTEGSLEAMVYTHVLKDAVDDGPMSPICWTAGNTVPMFLLHGSKDSVRVMRSNERIEALLKLQPGPVERLVEQGSDHFQTHMGLKDPDHPWYARLDAMIRNAG